MASIEELLKGFQNSDPLLPAKKAAQLLDLQEHTLNVWRCQRNKGRPAPDLPFVRVGRRAIRYRLSDVLRFIEQNRHADPEATK